MDEPPGDASDEAVGAARDATPLPCRVPVDHLTAHQVQLLRTVLRAGEVPFGIVRGEVVAPAEYADEIDRAVRWAAVDPAPDGDEHDDPDHRPVRAPLVKPPRPPMRDGRHQATRWRRWSAGIVDQAVLGVPIVLAHRAGADDWTAVALHACYYVPTTAVWGWTIGKLACGIRVVEGRRVGPPGVARSTARWLVTALPMIAAAIGMNADLAGGATMAVYAPILVNLQGLHDLAAGTVVVERFRTGPGVWVRHRAARQNA